METVVCKENVVAAKKGGGGGEGGRGGRAFALAQITDRLKDYTGPVSVRKKERARPCEEILDEF